MPKSWPTRDVLTRPRHRVKFPALTDEHVSEFIAWIAGRSILFDDVPNVFTVRSDPKDSKYVNLAIAAGARYLVSWDKHLLELMDKKFSEASVLDRVCPELRILDPETFLQEIRA